MVTRTIIATVASDGAIRLPDGVVRPGDTVSVQIEQAEDRRDTSPDEDEYLTIRTADTPQKKERFRQQIHEWGQRNRARMSEEERNFDWDAWMYDENGLPH
jgi:hypothetical protein